MQTSSHVGAPGAPVGPLMEPLWSLIYSNIVGIWVIIKDSCASIEPLWSLKIIVGFGGLS